MKKLVLLVLLSFVSFLAIAGDIEYIKILEDKWEYMTKTEYSHGLGIAFQVMHYTTQEKEGIDDYYLIISKGVNNGERIPAEARLLLKTSDGEIITLSNNIESESSGLLCWCYDAIGRLSSRETVERKDRYQSIRGRYKLEKTVLEKIRDKGIIKVRIETTGDSIDINYPEKENIWKNKTRTYANRFSVAVNSVFTLSSCIFNPLETNYFESL